MARISRESLLYCSTRRECFDCHSDGEDERAVEFQKRNKFSVPCCKKHFYAYRIAVNERNVKKYARRAAARREAGLCVSPGCHNKLIAPELLPPWVRESTCGMHSELREIPANRTSLLKFINDYWLTDEQRKGKAQNIIYKRRKGIILFSIEYSGWYHTMGIPTHDLLQRYQDQRAVQS